MTDPHVRTMALIRLLSAAIELTAAWLILRADRVERALRINGFLALIGPLVLVATTAVGLAGLAATGSPWRLVATAAGVALILLGTR